MFADLFTPEQLTILTQIILIDLVLAGDNAIIIGMVASKFPLEQRKKIIFFGIGGAVILRIILTLLTAYLLQITGLRLLGGILLLYIVYKLYTDVIKGSDHDENIKVDNSSFLKAIWTILLADFTMSLDNVLGVAGAAGDHYGFAGFGNSVRGAFAAGEAHGSPGTVTTMDYITIASEGNATDFGDARSSRYVVNGGVSNSTRGVWSGGATALELIEYVNFATLGNSLDFGNLMVPRRAAFGCSDSHGGLGGF